MTIPLEIATTIAELTKLEFQITNLKLIPSRPVFSILSGKHRSKLRGRGLDFSEVRKYSYGDDIRNIDWRVTARTKITHTKVFNEEKERPAFLIVDQSSSMFFASEGVMKSVMAAEIAAICGYKVLKAGDRVGGIVFNDDSFDSVRAKKSRKNLLHLFDNIVQKNRALVNRKLMVSNHDMIDKVLYQANNTLTHDNVVIVISDFQNLNEDGYKQLTTMSQHNDVIAIMVSDPMEMEIPKVKMPVSDGHSQILLKGRESTCDNYRDRSREFRDLTIDRFAKYGIPFMEFTTSRSVVDQIKDIFGK